jgi:O-antigen ligase
VTAQAVFPTPHRPLERATAVDAVAFAAAVGIVIVFSQAWLTALTGDATTPEVSGLVRAMFFPAYALGLVLLALEPLQGARAVVRQPLAILLVWIAAASMLWSVDPSETLRRTVALCLTTLCGLLVGARFRWATLAEALATAFAILAVGSFLVGLFVPSFGRMENLFPGAWRGFWIEKNLLGGNMAIGFTMIAAAALLRPKRALLWWPLAGLTLLLILLSTSKTALLACAVGVSGLVLVGLMRRGPSTRVAAIYGVATAAALGAMIALFAADVALAILGKDATLTGRTKIWAAVTRQITQHPWLGLGYGAPWTDTSVWGPAAEIAKEAGFRASHAHSSWLEQWLSLGIGGLLVWTAYFLETWVRAVRALFTDKGAYLVVPFLLVFTLTTLTESVAVIYNDMRWVIFVALAAKLALPDKAAPRPPVAPRRRRPSATVTTSAPPASAWATRRSNAPGSQPHGEGVWPTSWV